ncbi:MAG: hypothetical protein ABI824_14460 [Acidobacteriota bacterium]
MKLHIMNLWREILQNFRGILAELSDQNAYQRYLVAHGQAASPEAWREFQDHHWQAKSRRGRCC